MARRRVDLCLVWVIVSELRSVPDVSSTMLTQRLRTLHRQVQPLRAGSPHLRELDEQLTTFFTRSARRNSSGQQSEQLVQLSASLDGGELQHVTFDQGRRVGVEEGVPAPRCATNCVQGGRLR